MEYKRAVITGIGAVAPGAPNAKVFLNNLYKGKSAIEHIKALEDAGFECQVGGRSESFVDLEDPTLRYHEVHLANEAIQLTCAAALEAWQDAGLEVPEPDGEVDYRTGVCIGAIVPGFDVIAERVVPMVNKKKVRRLGSQIIQNTMPSGASAYLSSIFAAGAYSISLNSACSTGLDNIVNGVSSVCLGYADRMIVGATENFSIYNLAGFDSMRLMNREWNDAPERASRPMSAKAHGFVPGSGAGVLIIESLESAQKRDAKIYGEFVGSAINCGAQRGTGSMTYPNKDSVIKAIRDTFTYGIVKPEQIDYINGHLSGTTADVMEVTNWKNVFDVKKRQFPYINSTKALIGHCLGAAGALEFIAMILQMQHNFVHKALNTEDIHPDIEAAVGRASVPYERVEAPLRYAAKASFGFGDVNSVVLYKKWEN